MNRERLALPAVALVALVTLGSLGMAVPAPLAAQEPVDLAVVNRIRDEGFHRSQVMETLEHLSDVIGPRLTGSPAMKAANEWTRDRLAGWGLVNAHLEPFPFGRGWSFTHVSVDMVAPREVPLIALPKAWTPGTEGPVRAPVVKAKLDEEEDFDSYRGKLAGKIVLLDDARDLRDSTVPETRRFSDEELADLARFDVPRERRGDWRQRFRKRWQLRRARNEFLVSEGAVATVEASSRDGGIVHVAAGGSYHPGESTGVTGLVMAAEQYNRLVRLLDDGQEVELAIDVRATFHDDDPMAYDTVAEIPGSDKKDEVVMVGGHLDSWHGGDGATDNGAGSAVAMEAVRILQALGIHPRRTIRIALWSGEEQGLLGSRAYVARHFASRPEPQDPEQKKLPPFLRQETGPLTLKPEHAHLSGYFNLDNGTGRIRGIYTQENAAVVPLFAAWLAPFRDLGADTLTTRNTRGTDHLSFDAVGLPGFQFIQDAMDYESRTHHTNMDVYDHASREDLIEASVIIASFLYDAAMREEMLPRKPLPPDEE